MPHTAMLYPVFALAGWTMLVLLLVVAVRIRAASRGEVTTSDFRFGESAAVSERVGLPNRNYLNLLQIPILFYVACVLLYVTGGVSAAAVGLAWAYVASRVVHSLIHISINAVPARLTAFALSYVALTALWVLAAVHVARLEA